MKAKFEMLGPPGRVVISGEHVAAHQRRGYSFLQGEEAKFKKWQEEQAKSKKQQEEQVKQKVETPAPVPASEASKTDSVAAPKMTRRFSGEGE